MDRWKWDRRFLKMAELIGSWSKDPSTQTGSVIVDGFNRVISMGYNGFPRKIADDHRLHDRETKYSLVVHAEMNAILNSPRPVVGGTIYIHPFMPCDRCAVHIISAGITRVVSLIPDAERNERWGESFRRSRLIFQEAGVELLELNP